MPCTAVSFLPIIIQYLQFQLENCSLLAACIWYPWQQIREQSAVCMCPCLCVCVCVCVCVRAHLCLCVMFTDTLQLIGCWGAAVDPSLSGVSLYSCTHPKSIDTHKCEQTHTHTHTHTHVCYSKCVRS